MSDNAQSRQLVNGKPETVQSDLLWGCRAIGGAIGRNPRQTFHLLDSEEIKCAQKKGGRWVCSRAALLKEFGA